MFYTALPHADATLKEHILSDHRDHVRAGNQIYGADATDLYRNYLHDGQYHWGSNAVRAEYGNDNMQAVQYGAAGKDVAPFVARALDTLHYFHGVNPFGKVYLSNMYAYGATNSVNEIYHTWFAPKCNQLFCTKTAWDDAIESECGPRTGLCARWAPLPISSVRVYPRASYRPLGSLHRSRSVNPTEGFPIGRTCSVNRRSATRARTCSSCQDLSTKTPIK